MTAAPRRASLPVIAVAVAVMTIVPGAALAGLWRWAEGQVPPPPEPIPTAPTATGEPAVELRTSLLSLRRTPAPLVARASEDAFDRELASVLADLSPPSCAVVALDGTVRGAIRADQPVHPGNLMKVVVAVVALELLGPDHRFGTEVRSVRVDDGVVLGDLHLVGGGDPWLSSSELAGGPPGPVATSLDELADRLIAAGLRRVEGDIVGVDSRYSDPAVLAPDLAAATPTGALVVDGGRLFGAGIGRNPAQSAASELNRLLAARGVTITGRNRAGDLPPDELVTVAEITSVELIDSIRALLDGDDDAAADMLLQEVGLAGLGTGSRTAGAEVVVEHLRRWGASVTGVVVTDGSGRAPDSRLTCDVMATMLTRSGPAGSVAAMLDVGGILGRRPAGPGRWFEVATIDTDERADRVWARLDAVLAAYPPAIDPDRFGPT